MELRWGGQEGAGAGGLHWMALRNGASFRKIGLHRPVPLWPGSQRINLHDVNVTRRGNDRQIANLLEAFGYPA